MTVLCRSRAQAEAALEVAWLEEIILDFLEVIGRWAVALMPACVCVCVCVCVFVRIGTSHGQACAHIWMHAPRYRG